MNTTTLCDIAERGEEIMIIPSKSTELILKGLKLEFEESTLNKVNQLLSEYSVRNELSSVTCLLRLSREWANCAVEYSNKAISEVENEFVELAFVAPLKLGRLKEVILVFLDSLITEANYYINDWCNRTNLGDCWALHAKQMETARERTINNLEMLVDKYQKRNYTVNKNSEDTSLLDMSVNKLHPRVIRTSGKLYRDGHFRQAILDTYIDLVQAVKDKSKLNLDNTRLMQNAFSKESPKIIVSDDNDEQQGFMWLFSGAVMGIRNPKAHKLIQQSDPQRTLEWLAFASVLHRVLEESKLSQHEEASNVT